MSGKIAQFLFGRNSKDAQQAGEGNSSPHLFDDFNPNDYLDEYSKNVAASIIPLIEEYGSGDKKEQLYKKYYDSLPDEIKKLGCFSGFKVIAEQGITSHNISDGILASLHSLKYSSRSKSENKLKKRVKNSKYILGTLSELYATYVISIFQSISIFSGNMRNQDQANLLKTGVTWHMARYTGGEGNSYERGAIDFLDIFLIGEQDGVLFEQYSIEFFEDVFRLIILQYILLQEIYAFGNETKKDPEIGAKLVVGLEYLLTEINTLPPIENYAIKIINSTFDVNLRLRDYQAYRGSKLYELLESGTTQSHGVEVQISGKQADDLSSIIFRGAGLLFHTNKDRISPLIKYILQAENVDRDSLIALGNLLDKQEVHKQNEGYILILFISGVYNFSCIDSVSEEDIAVLGQNYIEYQKNDTTPKAKIDISFLSQVDYEVFKNILHLPEEELIFLSKNPEKLDDYIQIAGIMCELEKDLSFLPNTHPCFMGLSQLLSDLTPRNYSAADVKRSIRELYQQDSCYDTMQVIKEASDEGENAQILRLLQQFYLLLNDTQVEHRVGIMREFVQLDGYYQERLIVASKRQSTDEGRFHLEKIRGKIQFFVLYVQNQDPTWNEIDFVFELFLLEFDELIIQNDPDEVGNTQEQIDISDRIIQIYGGDFGDRLLEKFSCQDSLEIIASIGEKLETYMRQLFVDFIEDKPLDAETLSQKGYILESTLIFLRRFSIHNLRKVDKFFSFCWGVEDISEIEVLYTYFPYEEYSQRKSYKGLLDTVMKYLKSRDIGVIEDFIYENDSDNTSELAAENEVSESKPQQKRQKIRRKGNYSAYNRERGSLNEESDKMLKKVASWRTRREVVSSLQYLLSDNESYQAPVYIKALGRFRAHAIKTDGTYDSSLGEEEVLRFQTKILQGSYSFGSKDISDLLRNIQAINPRLVTHSFLNSLMRPINASDTDLYADQICSILYGFMFISSESLPDGLISYMLHKFKKIDILYPGDIAKALYGLAPHRNSENPDIRQLIDLLFSSLRKNFKFLSLADESEEKTDDPSIIMIKRVYSLYGKKIPQVYEEYYGGLVGSYNYYHPSESSSIERKTYLIIKKYFPDAIHGSYIRGFECDIIIPSLRLNIEVDGPQHIGIQKYKDQIRDSHLNTWDIDVVRITLGFKSEKEIIREVQELAAKLSSSTSLKS